MRTFSLKHAEQGFENFPNFEIFRRMQIKNQNPFKGFKPLICSDGFIHAEENETQYYISLMPEKPLTLAYRCHWCEGCGRDEYFNSISPEKLHLIKEELRKNLSLEQWNALQIDQALEQALTAFHKERPIQQYYPTLKEVKAYEKTTGYPYLYERPYLCVADEQTPSSLEVAQGDIILYTYIPSLEKETFTSFKEDKAYFSTYNKGIKQETTASDIKKIIQHLYCQLEGKDASLLEPLLSQSYQERINLDIHKNLEKIATQQNKTSIHSTKNILYSGMTGFLLTLGKITDKYFNNYVPTPPALIKHDQTKRFPHEAIHIKL